MSVLALWNLLPRWAKEVLVLLVAVAAIYTFGDCHGRAVQRQQDTSAEQARIIAHDVKLREAAKDTARAYRDSARATHDAVTRTITKFVTLRAASPTVLPEADRDTLHVWYPDGHIALLPVSDPVDSLVHELTAQLAVADTMTRQARQAQSVDSVAIAKLWHASQAADSLVEAQARALEHANEALAHCRPSPVGRVVKLAGWVALAYAGVTIYHAVRP